jgi:ComEC/Rec2-related protein
VKVLNGGTGFDHSDYVAARGFLYIPEGPRNPGGFDYAGYLRNKNIFAAMSVSGPHNVIIIKEGSSFLSAVVKPVRNYMIGAARENLAPVSAAILSGFILGERRDIPEEYQTMFRDTGTLHLMAVSGSNVGLVVAVFALPLTLLGLRRKRKVVFLFLVILFFAVLTRLEPSVVRASIMASIALLAWGWLRRPDYINLLGGAGLLMLLWKPLQLFDVGLQLSFAATFGIVYVVPGLYERTKPLFRKRLRWTRWVLVAVFTTLAAQAAVMPLMALYFNRFPLIGLVANLPIGFLASAASVAGVVLYFLSAAGGWLGFSASWLVGQILDLIQILLKFFSNLPLAVINTASFDWPLIILYWIILYLSYELIIRHRVSARGIITGLLCFNLLVWPRVFEKKPLWYIEFIDIGPNRAWIYTDGAGETMGCIDIYKEDKYLENTLVSNILNYHGGRLGWLATSTPDSYAIEFLRDQFSPEFIDLSSPLNHENPGNTDRDKISPEFPEGIKFVWGQSDNTEKGNNIPPCLRIDVGNYSLLLAGRRGLQAARRFKTDKKIGLLELPWSEYARTDCMRQINRMNPDYVVFSHDGKSENAPRKRSGLTHSAAKVLSTSICGGFRISETDGRLWVSAMKTYQIEER